MRAAALVGDIERALAGAAQDAAERLRELAHFGQRALQVALADHHFNTGAAHRGGTGEPNARLAQHPPHVVAQLLELLLAHRAGIDLEQEMRAALQIEAQHDVPLRPFRPALDRLFRKEIRHGEHAHEYAVSRMPNAFQREMYIMARRSLRCPKCPYELRLGNHPVSPLRPVSLWRRPSPARPWRARP